MKHINSFQLFAAAAMFSLLAGGAMMSCTSNKVSEKPATAVAEPAKPDFEPTQVTEPTTITFPSSDGIMITADVYMPYPETAPLILLCHRAKWSRGEYREIAPKLNLRGFNAIAIDQRSGKTVNGVDNQTAIATAQAGKPTKFVDALPDIQAALDYVKANYAKGTFILWGSSYSSSLGIVITKANQSKLDAYMAFSPGEYFADQGKETNWITTEAAGVSIPVFVTSNDTEHDSAQPIFNNLASTDKTYYLPSSPSKHASEALFEASSNSYWTWKAVDKFLLPYAYKR